MKIGFIGAGNMGGAILRGYAGATGEPGNEILVFDTGTEICAALERDFDNVTACKTMEELVSQSNVIFLGVKPNLFEELLPAISAVYTNDKTLISMAAGIPLQLMEKHLGTGAKIVRIMPNLPAQVKEAMIAACPNDNVDNQTLEQLMQIFQTIGRAERIPEDLIHCVIGVSGSSPAYTYLFIDALIRAAVKNGMNYERAKIFAAQSVLGAAKMVLETGLTPEQLRVNVCSPGGTTMEAISKLQENGFVENIKEGFQAAVEKSKSMEEEKI